ncbi:HD-GYP domain-containing protein [Neobacillus sp. PS3-40]|uniref:HD-GYP domain-containing protein n=1 Tax=Neobacillus sp. PS3-40 TaxID=3070679 RepID=UPI0027DF8A08|nr:HD-GYP domain-containing protein [Neobacillus sp. PS3-40]WML43230.1 HD-GYP domain-containing protein [Neobacillus sp. PS3-40]
MRNFKFIGLFLAIASPYILFECFRQGYIKDPYLIMPKGHFYIVSAVAVLAVIISISVGIAGKRLRNIKISFLSLSFISLAQMFLVHGLSTPDFILHESHLPGISSQLSILLATVWLWLSSLPSDSKLIEFISRYDHFLVPIWIVALGIFAGIGMVFPHLVTIVPMDVHPLNGVITMSIILLNLLTSYRYFQSYRYSKFPLQIAIVCSAGWLIVSQLIMVLGVVWKLSWWMYHILLLASMIVMLIGLVKQYSVKGSLVGSLRALFTNDPFERITGGISQSVRALVIATEKKDTYTAGHTFRVTMYALKLGEELNLAPEQLRALAQGALLHDVGKINIPDSVLNKPGRLTLDERIIIEKHPLKGYDMCRDLGFMKEELSVIRFHHEKWDGTGYPNKLQGENIPLLARVTAVVDVYDALTSERSYRKAWPHHQAMELLLEQKGTHFDPKFVDAWTQLCERNPSVYQYPSQMINDETTVSLLSFF